MDREQHVIQDAAEHYAVYVMQREAEALGRAISSSSAERLGEFHAYLAAHSLAPRDFERGLFGQYKVNADLQLPRFVDRLAEHYADDALEFECVEKEARDRGDKADFVIHRSSTRTPVPVSLKNYIGSGGVTRPQVASGTFASFAAGFVFERVGVGRYADPREAGATFRGADATTREAVLEAMGRSDLIRPLRTLDALQADVRREFLSADCEFYDRERVRRAAARVAEAGIAATLDFFTRIGLDQVRERFLSRIGLDGREEALFFDEARYVDSITNPRYHELRERLNAPETRFEVHQHKQSVRFTFASGEGPLLVTDVPFTINTNGAWFRPKERFTGTMTYVDKGHPVELRWGQRRPYKSREIATSVNTYIDLQRVGIFGA